MQAIEKRQAVENGLFGFLDDSNLSSKRSCYANIRGDCKRRLEFAILCSLYGKDHVEKKGYKYYYTHGRAYRTMMHILESEVTWESVAKKNGFVEPELLLAWNNDKFKRFETLNSIGLHFVTSEKQGKDIKLVDVRTPAISNPDKKAYIYIMKKSEVSPYMRKYFHVDFCYVAIIDINRFQCEKYSGCSYCNEYLRELHNTYMVATCDSENLIE